MRIPQPFFRKAKGAWYVQFGDKQISLGKDEKTALEKYSQLLRDRGMGQASPTTCTVHELIDGYLDWVQKNREDATYQSRCRILDATRIKHDGWRRRRRTSKSLRDFTLPNMQAEKLAKPVVQRWMDERKLSSPSTFHMYISIVSIMYNWGVRVGYVSKNPFADMDKPTPHVREEFIPPEQFEPFLAAISNDALRDYVQFALNTGARANEIRNLEAMHLNRKTKRFVLPLGKSKGRKRRRVIYLNDTAFTLVGRLVAKNPNGKLFRNSFDRPWSGASVAQAMIPLKEILGMPKFCATVLRHSFAHRCLSEKMDATTVAKLMGHVDTNMLNTRYGHLEESTHLDEAANKFQVGGAQVTAEDDAADLAKRMVAEHGANAYIKCLDLIPLALRVDDEALARSLSNALKIIKAGTSKKSATSLTLVG